MTTSESLLQDALFWRQGCRPLDVLGKVSRLRDLVRSVRAVSQPSRTAVGLSLPRLQKAAQPGKDDALSARSDNSKSFLSPSSHRLAVDKENNWLGAMHGIDSRPIRLQNNSKGQRLARLVSKPHFADNRALPANAHQVEEPTACVPSRIAGITGSTTYYRLDSRGELSACWTEAVIGLENDGNNEVAKSRRHPKVPLLKLAGISRRRNETNALVRDREKHDWRLTSFRDALGGAWRRTARRLPLGRYPSMGDASSYRLFGFGQRTIYAEKHGCALGTEIVNRRVCTISKHSCIISFVAVGFGGRAYLASSDDVAPRRHIAIRAYVPALCVCAELAVYMETLEHVVQAKLLSAGRRNELIDALCARLYFKYHVIQCWWRRKAPPKGAGMPARIGEYNKVEEAYGTVLGARSVTVIEHLEEHKTMDKIPANVNYVMKGVEAGELPPHDWSTSTRVAPELCIGNEIIEPAIIERHRNRIILRKAAEAAQVESERRWFARPKRYRGCVATFAMTLSPSKERVVLRVFQSPNNKFNDLVRLVTTRFPSMREHSMQVTIAELARFAGVGIDKLFTSVEFRRGLARAARFVNEALVDWQGAEASRSRAYVEASKGTARRVRCRGGAEVPMATNDLNALQLGHRLALPVTEYVSQPQIRDVAPKSERRKRTKPGRRAMCARREASRGKCVAAGVARVGGQKAIYEVIRRIGEFEMGDGSFEDAFDFDIHLPKRRRCTLTLHALDIARICKRDSADHTFAEPTQRGEWHAATLLILQSLDIQFEDNDAGSHAHQATTSEYYIHSETLVFEDPRIISAVRQAVSPQTCLQNDVPSNNAEDSLAPWHCVRRKDSFTAYPHVPRHHVPRRQLDAWLFSRFSLRIEPHLHDALLRCADGYDLREARRDQQKYFDTRVLSAFICYARKGAPLFSLRFDTLVYREEKVVQCISVHDEEQSTTTMAVTRRLPCIISVYQQADSLRVVVDEVESSRRYPLAWNPLEQRSLCLDLCPLPSEHTGIQLAVLLEDLVLQERHESEPVAALMSLNDERSDYENGRSEDILRDLDAKVTERWGSKWLKS